MSTITEQFRNTAINLFIDLSEGLGRNPRDTTWAAGFLIPCVGNLGHECGGFDQMEEGSPTVKGSLGGISFAQWTGMGKRRRGLFMAHCRKNKLHPYSYEAAISFILVELRGSHKNVVQATLSATVLQNTPKPKDVLMARVVRFEMLYEGAGVKHYASRYSRAQDATTVYAEWARAGYPKPAPFKMPKARWQADFDKEFGSGVGPKTVRAANNPYRAGPAAKPVERPKPSPAPAPAPVEAVEADTGPLATVETPAGPEKVPAVVVESDRNEPVALPAVKVQKGRWPESFLSKAEIETIQRRLRSLGYVRLGTVNGLWDSDMVATISKLQTNAGIEVDGHWGPATRQALADGVREVVTPERAAATKDTLKQAGEPTIVKTEPVRQGSLWGTITAGAGTALAGASSYFQTAREYIEPARDFLDRVPGWAWLLAIAVLAFILYRRLGSVQKTVVEGFRAGEVLTTEQPPPLPVGMTAMETTPTDPLARFSPEDQVRLREMMAAWDRDPTAGRV